jgi:glycogen synthase
MGSAGQRGRIVMLVQNGVENDSRVQKQAASAAAAGWDVVLLGRSPTGEQRVWNLGGAEVRLLRVNKGFGRRAHELRSHWLRDPLAYPLGPKERYRRHQLEAARADLVVAAARAGLGTGSPLGARWRRLDLARRRFAVERAVSWIELRSAHTERLAERRKRMAGIVGRTAIVFWAAVLGRRAWRRLDPALWDLELAFGPVVDELRPDLIHANDFQMLGVGARAKLRALAAGRDVKLVWDVHEYLPGIKSWIDHPAWKPAQLAHEREYAPWADAVVTVSETLADLLIQRFRLRGRPAVVMNAPDLAYDGEPVPDLRERCGIGPDMPLMVYSGAPMVRRGLPTMVEALPRLDGVHAAFVVDKPEWADVRLLEDLAKRLGVADRIHIVPYVPHRQVVRYLAAADVGVIPLHHYQNHEIALITKFFEYSHARLPIVVSDVKTMAATVRLTGQGEVFRAQDAGDLARAVRAVLADPARYRGAYDTTVPLRDWTWAAQAGVLDEVYAKTLAG